LTAGHGPAVILLHGYTQTSRHVEADHPLLAEKFTVIAPDLPGIGDSAIPKMVNEDCCHTRPCACQVRSVSKKPECGHDIGLMIATLTPHIPRRNGKTCGDGAFLPGVAGMEDVYNNPAIWHFRFNGRLQKRWWWTERTYFEHFWNNFAADKTHSIPESGPA